MSSCFASSKRHSTVRQCPNQHAQEASRQSAPTCQTAALTRVPAARLASQARKGPAASAVGGQWPTVSVRRHCDTGAVNTSPENSPLSAMVAGGTLPAALVAATTPPAREEGRARPTGLCGSSGSAAWPADRLPGLGWVSRQNASACMVIGSGTCY